MAGVISEVRNNPLSEKKSFIFLLINVQVVFIFFYLPFSVIDHTVTVCAYFVGRSVIFNGDGKRVIVEQEGSVCESIAGISFLPLFRVLRVKFFQNFGVFGIFTLALRGIEIPESENNVFIFS